MKNLIYNAVVAAIVAQSQAKTSDGACPKTFESNIPIEEFKSKPLTGLWFEYVWDKNFDDGFDYGCSMWTVLEDTTRYISFNHLHIPETDGKFA